MKHKIIHNNGQKTYILVFDTGDEVMETLTSFSKENGLTASHFTAIGAFSDAMLGFFDFQRKDYTSIPVTEQTEVLVLTGDIALYNNSPKIHAHVVLGKSDGRAIGGHLLSAHVRPTLEVVLTASPFYLQREMDEETHLPLITV